MPRCPSNAVFKTKASFNRHVRNVHTDPLRCDFPDCSYKKPFGRRTDRERHMQSVHSVERGFICSVASCDAQIKEFARKDHLVNHMREKHGGFFCPMTHCHRNTQNSFVMPEDLAKHVDDTHGLYECALRTCAKMPESRFSRDSLGSHLRKHHSMTNCDSQLLIKAIVKPYTCTDADLEFYSFRIRIPECKICEKRPSATKQKAC